MLQHRSHARCAVPRCRSAGRRTRGRSQRCKADTRPQQAQTLHASKPNNTPSGVKRETSSPALGVSGPQAPRHDIAKQTDVNEAPGDYQVPGWILLLRAYELLQGIDHEVDEQPNSERKVSAGSVGDVQLALVALEWLEQTNQPSRSQILQDVCLHLQR